MAASGEGEDFVGVAVLVVDMAKGGDGGGLGVGFVPIVGDAGVDGDVGEAVVVEMVAELIDDGGGIHVGDETDVDGGAGLVGDDGEGGATGITGDEIVDIEGRLEKVLIEPIVAGKVMAPAGDIPEVGVDFGVEVGGEFGEEGMVGGRGGADVVIEAGNSDVVAIGGSEGAEGLNEAEGGTVDDGFVTTVEGGVLGAVAGGGGIGDEFGVDDAFVAEFDDDVAFFVLARFDIEEEGSLLETVVVLGDDLGEVGAADLFFAFAEEHDVDGELAVGRDDGFEGVEEETVGPFAVISATGDDDLGEGVLGDEGGAEGVVGPRLVGDRLDIIHAVDGDGGGGTGIVVGPDGGVAGGGDNLDFLAAEGVVVVGEELGALVDAETGGADGGLLEVLLKFGEVVGLILEEIGLG